MRIHEIEIPIPPNIFRILDKPPLLTTLTIHPIPTPTCTPTLTPDPTSPQKIFLIFLFLEPFRQPPLRPRVHFDRAALSIPIFCLGPFLASFLIQKFVPSRIC